MVPRAYLAVDGGSISVVGTVGIVLVAGNAQCLRDDAVLEADVLGATARDGLVSAPGSSAVVYDGVVGTAHAHGVARVFTVDA